jgi:hypothetical protein
MTAIAIAVSPMAVPDETNKEEDILIMVRTEGMFHTKIRLWVGDSVKIFS